VAWAKVYFRTKWHLHVSSRLATIDVGQKLAGELCLFSCGSWVLIKHKVAWTEAYLRNKWHLDPSSHLATIDMGLKLGGSAPFLGRGAGSPSNTMWPGPRPTCMSSFILSHPTIWPQYTNVTDRQDRTGQRSDSIGRTVLETVAHCSFSVFYWILFTLVHCFYWRIL